MEEELKELGGQQAFLKGGIFGLAGSGKTRTSSEIAIGLAKFIKSEKPVYFFDTETGSDFVAPLFKKNGLRLVGKKSKAFSDLINAMHVAEKHCDIMQIDSITHVWNELCESFRRKKYECHKCGGTGKLNGAVCGNQKCNGSGTITDRLALWDYQPIKKEWTVFVELMLNSRLHVIVCGRAGYEYESQENLEGKLEIVKAGTKFKAESEFGYEASLLIEMRKEKTEKGIENVAFVWKDRFDFINGKEFKFPKFEDFLPHIEALNLGGEHISLESGSSVEMLKTPKGSPVEYDKYRQIALEKIQAAMLLQYPSQSAEDKKGKVECLKTAFGTHSWTEVENMQVNILEEGLLRLQEYFDQLNAEKTENGKVEKVPTLVKGGKK